MHTNANIGFHTNLVNNGTFENNLGLTGFYSATDILTVSGNNRPVFNNVEVDVVNNLELYISMGVTNELLFLTGKVITPRDQITIALDFIDHDLYAGETNSAHVDGYATVTSFDEFVFPIGDENRLRPMISPTQNVHTFLRGAYFYEDPNLPTTFNDDFTTTQKEFKIETVSTYEFWDLNGDTSTQITLTWDSLSNLQFISPNLRMVTVVGWNIANNQWEDLGNTAITGNMEIGTVTSKPFIPNQYEIITIGSVGKQPNNYNISPNGDGDTDTLVFDELQEFSYSELTIFNRWGTEVYHKKNYNDTFDGTSEGRVTVAKKTKLPAGTYFYELKYGQTERLNEFKTGWVYISR